MVAIDAVKDQTVIVFISGLNLHKTPKIVQDAIASDEADGPTPVIAVFDSKIEKQIGIVPYSDMKAVNGFDAVNAAVAKELGKEAKTMTTYKPETWGDRRGRSMQATFIASDGKEVTLKLESGSLSTMPVTQLSDESQKRVAELAGE